MVAVAATLAHAGELDGGCKVREIDEAENDGSWRNQQRYINLKIHRRYIWINVFTAEKKTFRKILRHQKILKHLKDSETKNSM